jgi:hypothetical protein
MQPHLELALVELQQRDFAQKYWKYSGSKKLEKIV